MTFSTCQNMCPTNGFKIDWLALIVSFQPITEFSGLVTDCEKLTRLSVPGLPIVQSCKMPKFNMGQEVPTYMSQPGTPRDKYYVSKIVFTSDTELASVDWDVGMQVVNVSSGERRQLLGPTIFVRLSHLSSSALNWFLRRMFVSLIESCGRDVFNSHLTRLSPTASTQHCKV